MDTEIQIQWDFHRTARAFVASQRRQSDPAAASSRGTDSSLQELNHWMVKRCETAFASRRQEEDGEAVYLLHPPVMVHVAPTVSEEDDLTAAAEDFNFEEDETHYAHPHCEYAEFTFSVVFNDTWRVPTLYFTCYRGDGAPLRRREVLDILLRGQRSARSSDEDEALWEFVSQEEHPVTGTPAYFLHPCRTADRMGELIKLRHEVDEVGDSCPLLSWMSMVLPAVGCKVSSLVFCRTMDILRSHASNAKQGAVHPGLELPENSSSSDKSVVRQENRN